MRLFIGGVIGLTMAWMVYSRSDDEYGRELDRTGQKYPPYVSGYVLPFFLVGLYLAGMIVIGTDVSCHLILSICFSVFLQISVYYAILLPLLPWLRQRISARACATLWSIPNFLYLVHQRYLVQSVPGLVLTVPGKLIWVLIWIWHAGFIGVLLWKITGHIVFRRQLLKNAVPCKDIAIRQQWVQALQQARFKNTDIPLMVSSGITTPVTVGLFQFSTVVVLPRKQYAPEELELIFLHEIVHIGRQDAWNKFFFVFCTAMCWFNPLMWAAMDRSAEDLELSCDETVLLDADPEVRRHYAHLLLHTAGDGRGFTTCLSSSARAMRYRLKSIVNPAKRSTGATVVGITFCLLAVTSGFVSLAYDETPGGEAIFRSGEAASYVLTVTDTNQPHSEEELAHADTAGITEYLSGLTMYRLTGQYSFSASTRHANFRLHLPGVHTDIVYVYDNAMEVYHLGQNMVGPLYYYIPDGIDWARLDAMILTS